MIQEKHVECKIMTGGMDMMAGQVDHHHNDDDDDDGDALDANGRHSVVMR